MDDYSALAYRIAGGVADVRGCLILSRDGLVLGSYPDDETAVKPAWMRFASLGDPERSFVEFGDQVWVYVRRPAYGAFAVADAGVRPGLVIDQLEQILLAAEEARARRDTLRVPDAAAAPSGKPRTSLHPPVERTEPVAAAATSEARAWSRADSTMLKRKGGDAEEDLPAVAEPATTDDVAQTGDAGPNGEPSAPSDETPGKKDSKKSDKRSDKKDDKHPSIELDADAEVDPVLLAKEFWGLLQVESGDDETTS
jgi:hypothetical protein